MKTAEKINFMYDFIHNTLTKVDAKESTALESMYFSQKGEIIQQETDESNAVTEYRMKAMDPRRLEATLDKNRAWKKQNKQSTNNGLAETIARVNF